MSDDKYAQARAELAITRQRLYNEQVKLKKYGLSDKEYKYMLKKQKRKCAICKRKMVPPSIDHDHNTGVVRELLCGTCNSGLGMFKDDPRLLAYALVYLEEHGKSFDPL